MSKSIQKNMTSLSLAIAVMFVISGFVTSIFCMNQISKKYLQNTADMVIDFTNTIINPDEAKEFLDTRTTDSSYDSVQKKLKDFQQKNQKFVNRISIINFSNSAGNYIYDTNDKKLGEHLEYNKYIKSVKADLISCRNSWSVYHDGILSIFEPIRTVEDKSAGYIIAEINNPYRNKYVIFSLILYSIFLIISFVVILIFNTYAKKKIFKPIRNFIEAIKNFISGNRSMIQDIPDAFAEEHYDEIGELGCELKKMFLNVNNNVENLSKAVYDANHDAMTQTLNKRCYQNMVQIFKRCTSICVIYFDVNNLKLMNDTLGHEKGDMVIKRTANYIKKFAEQNDYCFRMGGDEFLLVMTNCTFRHIDEVIEKIESNAPFILNRDSDPIKCALSFGYAYAKGEYSYDELLAEAEENMYSKKAELKNLLNMPER